MKKRLFKKSMLALGITSLLFAGACSGGDPSAPAEQGGSGGSIQFSIGHLNGTDHVQDKDALRPWSEEVTELTEGRITFEIYPGGSLGGPVDTYDNIITGIMDIGWGLPGYVAGKFPVHSVMNLPFLADGNAEQLSAVAQILYDEFPEIQAEYHEVKPLWFHAADPYAILTKGKPIRSFEDVKGLKLRSATTEQKEMIEAWGATPVTMGATETYDALQKGVIDGTVAPIAQLKDHTLFDVVDYITLGGFNTNAFFVVMNKSKWEQIPEEDRAKIEETIGLPMAKRAGKAFDQQAEASIKEAEEIYGIEFITLEDAELQKFKDASKVVTEKWLKEMEAKGIPGQEIYDRALQLIEEQKK